MPEKKHHTSCAICTIIAALAAFKDNNPTVTALSVISGLISAWTAASPFLESISIYRVVKVFARYIGFSDSYIAARNDIELGISRYQSSLRSFNYITQPLLLPSEDAAGYESDTESDNLEDGEIPFTSVQVLTAQTPSKKIGRIPKNGVSSTSPGPKNTAPKNHRSDENADEAIPAVGSAKIALRGYCRVRHYRCVVRTPLHGPDHARYWDSTVTIDGMEYGHAKDVDKEKAENEAASQALDLILRKDKQNKQGKLDRRGRQKGWRPNGDQNSVWNTSSLLAKERRRKRRVA
ncbi:hypothetical protein WG66_007421 [Moniliophthora roreri]|nr:hypothetical protein WG66_007421 [Moniliophthora roreri]